MRPEPHSDYRRRTPREFVSGRLFLDLGRDERDTVFLAGSGRSGTTFVSQLIESAGDFRYVFEPFHPDKVAVCRNFDRRQYLRPDDGREEYAEAAREILTGKVASAWSDRFNRRFLARRRLVKEIRANLMLGWLHARFPAMRIVYLLRHPCAVTDSRLRLGWRDNLDELMSRRDLVDDHLLPFERDISSARDAFERSVYLWCIENYVPLDVLSAQIGRGEIHLVRYEDLLSEPETELPRLFAYLGLEVPDLSGQTPDERRASGWIERVPAHRREWTYRTLRLFGLDRIYGLEGPVSGERSSGVPDPGGR